MARPDRQRDLTHYSGRNNSSLCTGSPLAMARQRAFVQVTMKGLVFQYVPADPDRISSCVCRHAFSCWRGGSADASHPCAIAITYTDANAASAPGHCENKDAPAAAPPAATAPATTQPAPVQGQQPATARPAQPVQVEDARLLPQDLLRRLDALVPELDRLTKAVDRVKDGDAALERQRDEIETLRTNAVDLRSAFTAPMKAVDEQLRKLGPRPKPPAPAETPAIQAERTRLVDSAIRPARCRNENAGADGRARTPTHRASADVP